MLVSSAICSKPVKSAIFRLSTTLKAIELLTNDAGRVIGVRAQGDLHKTDYFAKDGVVIATGGFSANRELLCRYMGGPLSRLVLRGSPYVTGDNLMLTAPVGAQLVHIDQFPLRPDR